MQQFAALYTALDETNKTSQKVAALSDYFRSAPPADAAWALYFLMGRRPKRPVNTTKLTLWAIEAAGIPQWLFEESYDAVGDLAEAITKVLPEPTEAEAKTFSAYVEQTILGLAGIEESEQKRIVLDTWAQLDTAERFVWNKLITGSFRVGVAAELVIRALSKVSGVPAPILTHRLTGNWTPGAELFSSLISEDHKDAGFSQPYPFCLAYPLEADPATLGDPQDWHIEWKWDGIRAQVIHRGGEVFVWSRGEDLVTERFPEVKAIAERLPEGTCLDGEILGWLEGRPMPFLGLQRRLGRKALGKKILSEVPVTFIAYDLLELAGQDLRQEPLSARLAKLEALGARQLRFEDRRWNHGEPGLEQAPADAAPPEGEFTLSPRVEGSRWDQLAEQRLRSRDLNVEGLMLKRLDSPYLVGRRKGQWWKWKVEPYSVDAVLIYAQRGSGKRASLYTDYTFGVWDGQSLVPFAKAYSGLTDEEIRKVDGFVRRNTLEKFGPVRTVAPELVFELGFESIQLSKRHKSGIAVRFPRILRWRTDKLKEEADTLETVRALITAPQ